MPYVSYRFDAETCRFPKRCMWAHPRQPCRCPGERIENGDLGSRNQSSGFGNGSSARKPDDANGPNQTPLNPQHSQGG